MFVKPTKGKRTFSDVTICEFKLRNFITYIDLQQLIRAVIFQCSFSHPLIFWQKYRKYPENENDLTFFVEYGQKIVPLHSSNKIELPMI